MRRRERDRDDIDFLGEEWAVVQRKVLGIILPEKMLPKEILGQMRCTLASVREDGEGASYSQSSQNWPEVYTKMGMLVHRGYMSMAGILRLTMFMHYVWDCYEVPIKIRADEIGISVAQYWINVGSFKSHLRGFIAATAMPNDDEIASRQEKAAI